MAQLFQCNFMRSCILEASEKYKHYSQSEEKYIFFQARFADLNLNLDKKYFLKKAKDLVAFYRKKKWCGDERQGYIEKFSSERWKSISVDERNKHSLHSCHACKALPV